MMKREELLRAALEDVLARSDPETERDKDPIGLVHDLPEEDREVGAFVAASLAFGRVTGIRRSVRKVFKAVTGREDGAGLRESLITTKHESLRQSLQGFVHRWIREDDIYLLLTSLADLLQEYDTIENAFLRETDNLADDRTGSALELAIERFVSRLLERTHEGPTNGLRWLLPSPVRGSASKRMCLFLRWVTRGPDGLDLGIWTRLSPARLIVPLDVHLHRIGRRIGLTDRATAGWRAAVEITQALARLDPEDPLKYDFAICHLGVRGDCPARPSPEACEPCAASAVCNESKKPD